MLPLPLEGCALPLVLLALAFSIVMNIGTTSYTGILQVCWAVRSERIDNFNFLNLRSCFYTCHVLLKHGQGEYVANYTENTLPECREAGVIAKYCTRLASVCCLFALMILFARLLRRSCRGHNTKVFGLMFTILALCCTTLAVGYFNHGCLNSESFPEGDVKPSTSMYLGALSGGVLAIVSCAAVLVG